MKECKGYQSEDCNEENLRQASKKFKNSEKMSKSTQDYRDTSADAE